VDDINVLNPLQTVVPACGQVQFCDPWNSSSIRISGTLSGVISVGVVLLVMRYGKCRADRLDDLSQRRGPSWEGWTDTEVGFT
jgi:hypothetical protein